MNQISRISLFRFYEELNDYLPERQRKRDIELIIKEPRMLRSVIMSLGIPLAVIDLILVNGVSVDFEHILEGGERVSVYPVFERLNIKNVTRLRRTTLRDHRFVLDPDLASLAEVMKKSGFDIVWSPVISDQEIRAISIRKKRVILTKRKALARFPGITRAVLIHADDETDQMQELIDLLDIEKPGTGLS
jgi:hypothetical protein